MKTTENKRNLVLNIGLAREKDNLPDLNKFFVNDFLNFYFRRFFTSVNLVRTRTQYVRHNNIVENTLICEISFNEIPTIDIDFIIVELCHMLNQNAIAYKYNGQGKIAHHKAAIDFYGEFNEQYFINY